MGSLGQNAPLQSRSPQGTMVVTAAGGQNIHLGVDRPLRCATGRRQLHLHLHLRRQTRSCHPPSQGTAAPAGTAESAMYPTLRSRLGRLIRFYVPALGIPLYEPLMGLVDTFFLAQAANRIDVAALPPALTALNALFYVCNAIAIASARYYTTLAESERAVSSSNCVLLSAIVGGMAAVFVYVCGDALAEVFSSIVEAQGPAREYLQIRAWGLPFAIATLTAQALVLTSGGATQALRAILIAAVVNIFLDWLLVAKLGMSVVGAAWATVLAQIVAGISMFIAVSKKIGTAIPQQPLKTFRALAEALVPLAFLYAAKNGCYILVQGSAARCPEVTWVAAHQVAYALFSVLSFCATPIETAALVFLTNRSVVETRKWRSALLALGVVVGSGEAAIFLILLVVTPAIMTPDIGLYSHLLELAVPGSVALILTGPESAFAGSLLAAGATMELKYIAKVMIFALFVVASVVSIGNGRMISAWIALATFFAIRAFFNGLRVRYIWRPISH